VRTVLLSLALVICVLCLLIVRIYRSRIARYLSDLDLSSVEQVPKEDEVKLDSRKEAEKRARRVETEEDAWLDFLQDGKIDGIDPGDMSLDLRERKS